MAAMLPAIHSPGPGGHLAKSPTIQQHQVMTPQSKDTKSLLMTSSKKAVGRKERELETKRQMLRAQQPLLTKRQTAQ